MKKKLTISIFGASLILTSILITEASSFQQKEKSTEEILFEQIETVTTASRREQRIQDSPATISVITEEDIKESGALSIPDILRFVPGIDVMQITSSHWEVNARGLNQIRSNKMLVMIDGRSVYFDYFGGVIWQSLPIVLEDIKRIEVIRSPISALYGANALSGVINIITKSPRESSGMYFSAEKGNLNSEGASLVYGKRKGKLGYKFSGVLRDISSWRDVNINSEERFIANFKTDYLINGRSTFSFDAGYETGNIEQIILSSILKFDGFTHYVKANYNYSNVKAQFFWNHGDITSPPFVGYGNDYKSKYDTFDGEVSQTFYIGSQNTLILGGSIRINDFEANFIDADHRQNLYAGFVQDEVTLNNKVRALVGIRIDNHPLVDNNFSPRISINYEPKKNHTLRFAASNAFRNPTFSDSYLQVSLAPIPYPAPPFPPGSMTEIMIKGNENLKPENIKTVEFGYRTFFQQMIKLKIDMFYNRISDFIGTGDFKIERFLTDPDTGEPLSDPTTGMPLPGAITQSFVNLGHATAYGGEFEFDWLLNNWLRLRGNYSYIDLKNRYTLNHYERPAKHKFNFISDFTVSDRISFSSLGHYVGKSRWDIDTDNNSIPEKHNTDSYFSLDTRFTFKINASKMYADIIAQNLLNNKHKEYPIAESIGRRLSVRLNVKF